MRLLEQPGADLVAALLLPEQLLLDALGGHARGADDDERRVGARRPLVEQARGDLLARSGRAGDQDAAARRGDALDRGADVVDDGAAAGQLGLDPGALAQFLVVAAQALDLGSAADDEQQRLGAEGLFDEVVGAALDRADGGFDVAVARDDDDGERRVAALDLLEQLDAVEARALQPDVEDEQ